MHKFIKFTALSLLISCLFLCACAAPAGGDEKVDNVEEIVADHVHNWSQEYLIDGERHYRVCDGCGEKAYGGHYYIDGKCKCGTILVHEHIWSERWYSDESNHWRKCSICNGITDSAAHDISGRTCTVCGKMTDSEGLDFYWDEWDGYGGATEYQAEVAVPTPI